MKWKFSSVVNIKLFQQHSLKSMIEGNRAAYKANPGVEGSTGEGVPAGIETRAELH